MDEEDENICSICLLELKNDIIKLDCQHIFHDKCIKKWREKKNTCPICRNLINNLISIPNKKNRNKNLIYKNIIYLSLLLLSIYSIIILSKKYNIFIIKIYMSLNAINVVHKLIEFIIFIIKLPKIIIIKIFNYIIIIVKNILYIPVYLFNIICEVIKEIINELYLSMIKIMKEIINYLYLGIMKLIKFIKDILIKAFNLMSNIITKFIRSVL